MYSGVNEVKLIKVSRFGDTHRGTSSKSNDIKIMSI